MDSARSQDHRAAWALLGALAVLGIAAAAIAGATYPGAPVVLRVFNGLAGTALAVACMWFVTEVLS